MRVLLLCHAFNSLSQRLFVEMARCGHDVTVELDINDAVTIEGVELAQPDVIVAPFLKRAIPKEVHERTVCLVVHPGPPGDRGPDALDRAILDGEAEWGVTLLQATAELDGGPVWGSERFQMRAAAKSSVYRNEVTEAAARLVTETLPRLGKDEPAPAPPGVFRPTVKQAERAIDWRHDDSASVLRKIRSADGQPGVVDELLGRQVRLFDASAANMSGQRGAILGRGAGGAICRATVDGAVWIGCLRLAEPDSVKLPSALALGAPASELALLEGDEKIAYDEQDGVGYLSFPVYNGAMSTAICRRLLIALRSALSRPTRVLVLEGGPDFWSNGLDLCTIEAASSAADESFANIEAMDDLSEAIIRTADRLVVCAMAGNAGAGGVFLALAGDEVWARSGVVLNPHYRSMGNLFGSEYWTYLLPRRVGEARVADVMAARLPIGTGEALGLRLIDAHFGDGVGSFRDEVRRRARALAADPELDARLKEKAARRQSDESRRPLADYRREELERMRLNFYGFDPSYHVARYNFVRRVAKSRTPLHLARHRRAR